MIQVTLVDDAGEVLRVLTASDPETVLLNVRTGEHAIIAQPPDADAWWNFEATTWTIKPPSPGASFIWNAQSKEWFDPRTLQDLKDTQLATLKVDRDAAINGGFTWDGSAFDSDPTAQMRLMGLREDATGSDYQPSAWRLADNSWRVLEAADAVAVWSAFKAHLRGCFETFAGLEAQVNAATTAGAIEAITWP